MSKLLLWLAIGFILWRIVRSFTRRTPSAPQVREQQRTEERIESRRGPDIDYSRVRDADYRDVGQRERDERERDDRERGEGERGGRDDRGRDERGSRERDDNDERGEVGDRPR